jgi:ZIP family zinc transporter
MEILKATLLGLVTGISGTFAGGLIILGQCSESLAKQSWLLGFSGGIMTAVVLFDLWPEALSFGGFYPTMIGIGIGMVLVQYFDKVLALVPWYRRHHFTKLARIGILLGLGIGAHNFPEGVALGTTFIANREITKWIGLALIMALHNIPEGVVMTSAFKLAKIGLFKILIALVMVEIPMALGGTVGAILGRVSPWMVSQSLGFAGGAMLLLVIKELLPMAQRLAGIIWVGSGLTVGILAGVLLVRIL